MLFVAQKAEHDQKKVFFSLALKVTLGNFCSMGEFSIETILLLGQSEWFANTHHFIILNKHILDVVSTNCWLPRYYSLQHDAVVSCVQLQLPQCCRSGSSSSLQWWALWWWWSYSPSWSLLAAAEGAVVPGRSTWHLLPCPVSNLTFMWGCLVSCYVCYIPVGQHSRPGPLGSDSIESWVSRPAIAPSWLH